ncbi:YueI family protein [Halocella sp. SP3-1]|uniref:YueI family protein n=1 Tax=Halocella sp. SP3-1 TaxID=2382161 RepID=UPI000F759A53|nr:YueI family protein [Halocella sp. SP3-1]AZO93949.1 DUF1694 domain-containing protein [Halocella sp. SP3-1]
MQREKSSLEEKVMEGIYGKKEIKKEERNLFLGEYLERVICYLTYEQVIEKGTYPEILEALRHPEAKKLIIDRDVKLSAANDYIKLASKNGLLFKRIDSPDFKGDVALVVVSDHAVDIKKREVLTRAESLQARGISDKIIENVGAKLCHDCYRQLEEKAPAELINYSKLSLVDRLLGTECICKDY